MGVRGVRAPQEGQDIVHDAFDAGFGPEPGKLYRVHPCHRCGRVDGLHGEACRETTKAPDTFARALDERCHQLDQEFQRQENRELFEDGCGPSLYTPDELERMNASLFGESNDARTYSPMPRSSAQAEYRTTDPVTGGQKGTKLARFDLIPPEALWELTEVYGRGAQKYADRNWEKGYKWGLSVAALLRHLFTWLMGAKRDEDGNHHLAQVAWHAFTLFTYETRGLGTDDVHGNPLGSLR